jgi:uncharacterized protein YqgV (UPF0045/DUF77 family)
MVLLEFQISPRADGDSVSALLAQAIDIVDRGEDGEGRAGAR